MREGWSLTSLVAYATNRKTSITGVTRMEMLNVGKWNSQAAESARHKLEKAAAKGLPAVGFSIVYMDHKGDYIEWKYETHLAFDPDNPPPEEERKKLETILDGYAEICQKLMDGKEKH